MRHCNQARFRRQVRFLRRQFLQDDDLPFSNLLSEEIVKQALAAVSFVWNDRIYTPLVTLWVFLGQVLSADHSCRAAVARLVTHRIANGESPCSAETGAYWQARKRLPEKFFSTVTRLVGRQLEDQAQGNWLWKRHHVYMFDGTTVSMPDTPTNQAAYPQVYNQKPGLGFPIARVCTMISLSCGAVLDLGISRYAGKGQGERSLLRKPWDVLSPGDVLLTDALMSTWYEMLTLKRRAVDSVSRLNKAHRRADFRRGKRLGKGDHIVRWPKPNRLIGGLTWATYKNLPENLRGQGIAIDGKTLRGSFDHAEGTAAVHTITAFATETRTVLRQMSVDDKSNEIPAVPKLLELIELAGAVVTLDAMHCQTETAQAIVDRRATYILTVKGNQPTLFAELLDRFSEYANVDFRVAGLRKHVTVERSHGRHERREYFVKAIDSGDRLFDRWPQAKSFGMVYRVREEKGEVQQETVFFITNHPPKVKSLSRHLRSHWTIENSQHWVLDVTFAEDASRIRKGAGPEIARAFRRMALTILQRDTTINENIRGKRLRAGWDETVLDAIYTGSTAI